MAIKTFLLDTDFVFEVLAGNKTATDIVYAENEDMFYMSHVSIMELTKATRNNQQLQRMIKRVNFAVPVPVVDDVSYLAMEMVHKYHLSHGLTLVDAFIAATSLHYSFELLTCNLKDYQYIPALQLVQHKVKPMRRGGTLFNLL